MHGYSDENEMVKKRFQWAIADACPHSVCGIDSEDDICLGSGSVREVQDFRFIKNIGDSPDDEPQTVAAYSNYNWPYCTYNTRLGSTRKNRWWLVVGSGDLCSCTKTKITGHNKVNAWLYFVMLLDKQLLYQRTTQFFNIHVCFSIYLYPLSFVCLSVCFLTGRNTQHQWYDKVTRKLTQLDTPKKIDDLF